MTMKILASKGVSNREIARTLNLNEATVRYHLKRINADIPDGRARQQRCAAQFSDAIEHWRKQNRTIANTADLHDWLVNEHGYTGSLRSVQRFVAERYPAPKKRTRRRVETPPGAQAQADWAHFPGTVIAGEPCLISSFHLKLSYSRMPAVIWSRSQCTCSWLDAHNRAFERLGGIPATVRVDNCKTAVVRGAGVWGTLNETYRRYAQTVRFHIDPCPPREPRAKGKVERDVRSQRSHFDPTSRSWDSVEQLQQEADRRLEQHLKRRRCPATGTSVLEAFDAERAFLAPLPTTLPQPFDTIATRSVGMDCMIAFESRHYSVPFRYVGERVEVRGVNAAVQIFHGLELIAEHPRQTEQRVVTDSAHFTGQPTETHLPPPPLGRLGSILEHLGELPVESRPTDLYAAIAEGLAR